MDRKNPLYMIVFPYAGGSAASYMDWQEKFSCQVVTLEYPGHGTRLAEKCISDVDELSTLLAHEIGDMLPGNTHVILYGHSMGGILAGLTAKKLESQSQIQPVCLLLSSCGFRVDSEYSVESVIEYLLQSGKISGKVKRSSLFEKYIMPVLENDISMMNCYDMESLVSGCHFSIPVYAFYGEDDLLLDKDSMNHLRKMTTGPFRLWAFSGAHFFMDEKQNRETFFHLLTEIIDRMCIMEHHGK